MSHSPYSTRHRLEVIQQEVTDRDWSILLSLQNCRYLTGQQIFRLYFGAGAVNPAAALSASYRCLNRLKDYGLIWALSRRIGGVRHGSGSYVWSLTSVGYRLLHLDKPDRFQQKNFREPSLQFLKHTLLIAEAYLQLTEICARHQMTLAHIRFEPDCWRRYAGKGGKSTVLKPDLYAVVQGGGYEDRWFFEIDCATETVARILDKCARYIGYLRTGAEQQQAGVFPYVVWVVPDMKRKQSVAAHIRKALPQGENVFISITPDELECLIVGGAAEYMHRSAAGGRHVILSLYFCSRASVCEPPA